MKKNIIIAVIIAIVIAGYFYFYQPKKSPPENVISGIDGYIIIGHEARSFQPCGSEKLFWLMGDSPALQETMNKYNEIMSASKPYTAVFATLEGDFVPPPTDGFGMDYKQAFSIKKFVSIDPLGMCPNDTPLGRNPKNSTYIIEGKIITLIDGKAETEIVPGSASKTITQYFGNEAKGDFNGDGSEDKAFLLTQNSGGSGTFFYVAVALGGDEGYMGTNAVLLGDRIAPQTTEFRNGEIIVNYADRYPGEPMTVRASLGVSKYLKIIDGILKDVTPKIGEVEARAIAEKSCIKSGESLASGYYNENSKTWWFDANLKATPAGCNPACVVSEETKTAEINWRCTGAVVPK